MTADEVIQSSLIPNHAVGIYEASGHSLAISTTHNFQMPMPIYQGVLLSLNDTVYLYRSIRDILDRGPSSEKIALRSSLFNHDTIAIEFGASSVDIGVKQRSEPMIVTMAHDDCRRILELLGGKIYDMSSPLEKLSIGASGLI